jgi:hypothetical protein
MTEKKAKITDENRVESAALLAIWQAKHTLSQADFGEAYGLGNQSNVGHYLHARNPINLKAAMAFAAHLECEVSAFSPRLARELKAVSHGEITHSADEASTSAVRAYSDTNVRQAPVIEWARLGVDLNKKPQELAEATHLPYANKPGASEQCKFVQLETSDLAPDLLRGDLMLLDPENKEPRRDQIALFSVHGGEFVAMRYRPTVDGFEAYNAKGVVLDARKHGLKVEAVCISMQRFNP